METSKDTTLEGAKTGHRCCSGMHRGWWFVRFLAAILVMLVVFSAGVAAGKHSNRVYGHGLRGMMSYDHMRRGEAFGFGPGMRGEWGRGDFGMMRVGNNFPGQNLVREFGPIKKLEGNKITITDNAGKDQVIISQSSTTILAITGETDLKSLAVGQRISAFGALDKDNALQATVIKIQ